MIVLQVFKNANAPFPPLYLEPGFDFAQRNVLLIFHFGNSYSTLTLEEAEEPDMKLLTSIGSSKKKEFHKNTYFCFIDYAKTFGYVDHNKLWRILKELGIPDHLTCLLRNLCRSGSDS